MPVIQGKRPRRPVPIKSKRREASNPRLTVTELEKSRRKNPRLADLLWKIKRMLSQYGETGQLGDEERVGSGKLSLLPPSLGGDPSLEDLLQG